MIKVSAPGRCAILGNPTDLYGGSVISCTTRERAQCLLDSTPQESGFTIELSGDKQHIDRVADLALRGDDLDLARAVLTALDIDPATTRPFCLDITTTIPKRAGLGCATAMTATAVGAVLAHLGVRLSRYELAELVRKIEYDYLGIVCGFEDPYMAIFGGLSYLDFRGKNSTSSQDAFAPFATVENLDEYVEDLPFILAIPNVTQPTTTQQTELRDRWFAGDASVVGAFSRVAQLAQLGKKALLAGEWELLATNMNETYAIKRDLGRVNEANDALVSAALAGGALAAKLASSDGSGAVVAMTFEPERTIEALNAAGASSILYPAPSAGLTVEIVV